jgi:hypothetical protein
VRETSEVNLFLVINSEQVWNRPDCSGKPGVCVEVLRGEGEDL